MAKPAKKITDPEWQAARKADRHRYPTTITLRLPAEQKARWLAAAGGIPITQWIAGIVEETLGNPSNSDTKGE
jgi:hypothetical protein